ncbi:MAG: response regulator [Leptolyngbyaceae cyanobacterium bins.59]|nr:response regulator [Leptolyngbyaceae cyanobacterium bins.59]
MGRGVSQESRPIYLLAQLVHSAATGFLQVSGESISWWFYLDDGKITYATQSIYPFERLALHLRRLSRQVMTLNQEVMHRLREMFDRDAVGTFTNHTNNDYYAICWLVDQRILSPTDAIPLVEGLVREAIESLLLLQEGSCEFFEHQDETPKFCRLDLVPLIDYCRRRLQTWQTFAPQVWSPYQRPYLFSQAQSQQKISPQLHQKLQTILKGYSFRHLAVLLNQDELALVKNLYPYITNGIILLREPKSPFDHLPRIPDRPLQTVPVTPPVTNPNPTLDSAPLQPPSPPAFPQETPTARQTYTIACIDDSPSILNEMRRFLDDESFVVYAINDPLKALLQVIRLKPDLILLDIGMPGIDGYKLCRLLRNHSLFNHTPIIMVTGNTGIIDRAKAKFVGASDYLTKPFTKSELLKVVFRHLP